MKNNVKENVIIGLNLTSNSSLSSSSMIELLLFWLLMLSLFKLVIVLL